MRVFIVTLAMAFALAWVATVTGFDLEFTYRLHYISNVTFAAALLVTAWLGRRVLFCTALNRAILGIAFSVAVGFLAKSTGGHLLAMSPEAMGVFHLVVVGLVVMACAATLDLRLAVPSAIYIAAFLVSAARPATLLHATFVLNGRMARVDHLSHVAIVVHARPAVEVAAPLVRHIVEVFVAVERRVPAAPHEAEHVALRGAALAVKLRDPPGEELAEREPRLPAPPRVHVFDAGDVVAKEGRERELEARPARDHRRKSDAVGDHAVHAAHRAPKQTHEKRHRAQAVRDYVDARRLPHGGPDLRERRRKIEERDVVHRVAMAAQVVAVPIAHPKIEGPHIRIPAIEEILHEVGVLGHDEHIARGREPVHEEDDVLAGLALKAEHAQAEPILGLEGMRANVGVAHALRRVERNLPLE